METKNGLLLFPLCCLSSLHDVRDAQCDVSTPGLSQEETKAKDEGLSARVASHSSSVALSNDFYKEGGMPSLFFFPSLSFSTSTSSKKLPKLQVIVDFTATWCGPCRMIGPYFEELSGEFTGIVFLKVDVDENEKVAATCEVKAMPTFQVFVGGAKKEELVGASKEKLRALVEKYA